MPRLTALFLLLPASLLVNGCAVVTVTSAAVSVAATAVEVGAKTVGLAADATIGTARLVGRAVSGEEGETELNAKPAADAKPAAKARVAQPARSAAPRTDDVVAEPAALTQPVAAAGTAQITPLAPEEPIAARALSEPIAAPDRSVLHRR